jgi:hypothetical protein
VPQHQNEPAPLMAGDYFEQVLDGYFQGWRDGYAQALNDVESLMGDEN